jgi:hydrogenase/urease accessory protein HupE
MHPKRILGLILPALVLPATALAHPGHDGHELTWDFGTGLGHQLATLSVLITPLVIGIWFALRVRRARSKLARVATETRERRG